MRLSIILFSALALALPLKDISSEYDQLLALVKGSHSSDLTKRELKSYIIMFTEDASISAKLAHVKNILQNTEHNAHIEKVYDVGKSANGTGVVGYVGSFSNATLALIAESGCVSIQQEDTTVHGLGYESPNSIEKRAKFETSGNAPWHLARISHASNPQGTPQGSEYVYRDGTIDTNIYIVDSGTRVSHSIFGGRAHWGANFYNNIDEDEHGHGTAVAGIAASVSLKAQIIAVKVLGPQNSGSLSGIISGLEWAINNAATQKGRSIINMSIGSDNTEVYQRLISKAVAMGIPLTFAAGNSNNDACSVAPASYSKDFNGVYTVGASTENDEQASWSGWGSCVTLLAPGEDIRTASRRGDDVYSTWVGSSMSAPQVAGIASYWLSIIPFDLPSLDWMLTQNIGRLQTHSNTPNIIAWNFHP